MRRDNKEIQLSPKPRKVNMKNYLFVILTSFILLTPSLFAQTPAPIPEEARKHFVMGTTLFKDAKTADDFAQVVAEFKQSTDLAPQWPDARYNLALAKEAAGDYSGAMEDLKLYQKFKLSESEARTVQDKIYALEAKAEAAAKKQAADHQAAAAEEQKKKDHQDKLGFLEGTWVRTNTLHCTCGFDGRVFSGQAAITITGRTVLITDPQDKSQLLRGSIEGDDYRSIKWILQGDSNDPAPDYPITVRIEPHRISWSRPSILSGHSTWSFLTTSDYELTRP